MRLLNALYMSVKALYLTNYCNMSKLLVILKWFVITVPLGLFGLVTAPILYPVYYFTGWKFLWIYSDDKRINDDGTFYPDYKVFLIQKVGEPKETFWACYQWHGFRNRIWNLRTWIEFLQTGDGTGLTDLEVVIDDLWLNDKQVYDGRDPWKQEAGLKYLAGPGQNPWQVWSGDVIDFRYSIIGQSLIWFKQDGILSFRYSYCKLWFGRWVTLKINTFKSDTVLTLKKIK